MMAQAKINIIGNDVFIGSNTSLIAPVTLADGVTTGAGSVMPRMLRPVSSRYHGRNKLVSKAISGLRSLRTRICVALLQPLPSVLFNQS